MLNKIEAFLADHHLLTLATAGERLWCCSAFFVYDPQEVAFVIASDPETEHARNVRSRPEVSGTVALETKTVGKIRGVQFAGEMVRTDESEDRERYFAAFPYARVMSPVLWKVRLHEIKMTDNTLGFGKKLMWKRELSE